MKTFCKQKLYQLGLWLCGRDYLSLAVEAAAEHDRARREEQLSNELCAAWQAEKSDMERNHRAEVRLLRRELERIRPFTKVIKDTQAPEWRAEHQDIAGSFFVSGDTGKRMLDVLNYTAAFHAEEATKPHQDLQYMAGVVTGYRFCITDIMKLSAPSQPLPEEKTSTIAGSKVTDYRPYLTP